MVAVVMILLTDVHLEPRQLSVIATLMHANNMSRCRTLKCAEEHHMLPLTRNLIENCNSIEGNDVDPAEELAVVALRVSCGFR